jgi:hypothetical protein
MPTTTPAAIPAVLGLLSSWAGADDGVEDGVLTGAADVCVGFADAAEDEELWGLK